MRAWARYLFCERIECFCVRLPQYTYKSIFSFSFSSHSFSLLFVCIDGSKSKSEINSEERISDEIIESKCFCNRAIIWVLIICIIKVIRRNCRWIQRYWRRMKCRDTWIWFRTHWKRDGRCMRRKRVASIIASKYRMIAAAFAYPSIGICVSNKMLNMQMHFCGYLSHFLARIERLRYSLKLCDDKRKGNAPFIFFSLFVASFASVASLSLWLEYGNWKYIFHCVNSVKSEEKKT